MSYEFKKLSNTEVVATVGDSASILIEENGVIKRAPKDEVGGGVKVASSAKVGQTIVVKAVDENGNPTEWECTDGGIKVASTAKVGQTIIVKAIDENGNPTEWQCVDRDGLPKGTVILPETTWTFNEIGIDGIQTVDETVNFTLGEEYVVIWDGITYNCTCFSYSGEAIGNFSTVGGPSNDEPFGMWSSGNFFAYEIGTHTFSIYKNDATGQADWNENDETSAAYIQNRPFYEKNVETIAIESQTVNLTVSGSRAKSDLTYVNYIPCDGICKVIFDGVVYDDIAAYEIASDLSICVEFTTENGEKVYIYDSRSISGPASLAGQHTIEVFIKEIFIQTIDNKFIDYNIKKGTGDYSVILNDGKAASGHFSHAEGQGTTASGSCSHAEGQGTTASGDESHAEGWNTVASGEDSHAEGYNTTASGKHSHAEGYKTVAQRANQHVQGKFNILDTDGSDVTSSGKYLHIVGNGTSNTKRSNAHTLDWDGNAWYQGEVYVGGMSQDDENAVKLAKVTDISEAMQDFVFDQADWNEFDETSMAYIKNKPFGEFKEIYYAKQTVNCTDLGKYVFPSDYKCAKIERIAEAPWNEKCTIILDDIVYENVLVTEHGVEMTSLIEFLTNNGDKIIIDIAGNVLGVPPALAGEHTIEVFKTATSIVQLDNKFIPYILNSSTEGSTKRFRITVDDSGTLSAVEVTE